MKWREASSELVNIGRDLERIERALRTIRATTAVKDPDARLALAEAYSAARRLVDSLDTLRRQGD